MAQLNEDQISALKKLEGKQNVFLTGRAGTGKSFLVRHFLHGLNPDDAPVLASTGAAAILLGGRTFHSFFGLGIMEGGTAKTVERSLRNPKNVKRIRRARMVLVDEVSMLSGETLAAAEQISRLARNADEPWGGMRVIFVGDFGQLPPVTKRDERVDWAFTHEVWERSNLQPAVLMQIMRTKEASWLDVLGKVREGICDAHVQNSLNERKLPVDEDFEATRLFPHRHTAEEYNLFRLDKLSGEATEIETEYKGEERAIETLKRQAPIPEKLLLKEGALVMLRRNHQEGTYVNGSLAHVIRITKDELTLELLDWGYEIELQKESFDLYDGDGEVIASAKNFPLTLAYGSTIHKAQGTTLDRLVVDLRSLWEAGQAYVALSRVRSVEGLYLSGWTARSIKADPTVRNYYRAIEESSI